MLEQIFHFAGIPTLIGLVALYFAYRVMILGDIKSIRSKDKPEPKDKEGYCRHFSDGSPGVDQRGRGSRGDHCMGGCLICALEEARGQVRVR